MRAVIRGVLIASALIFLGLIIEGKADQPVVDIQSISKQIEIINEMKKQIAVLNEQRAALQAQIDAVGRATKIALPLLNFKQFGSQLKSDIKCLLPDLSNLWPKVSYLSHNLESICDRSVIYRGALWVHPVSIKKLPVAEQEKARVQIKKQREDMFVETMSKSLAQSDVSLMAARDGAKAADDLQLSVTSTVDMNSRLQTIAQGQVGIMRQQAETNKLLAELLKVMSVYSTLAIGDLESPKATDKDGKPAVAPATTATIPGFGRR